MIVLTKDAVATKKILNTAINAFGNYYLDFTQIISIYNKFMRYQGFFQIWEKEVMNTLTIEDMLQINTTIDTWHNFCYRCEDCDNISNVLATFNAPCFLYSYFVECRCKKCNNAIFYRYSNMNDYAQKLAPDFFQSNIGQNIFSTVPEDKVKQTLKTIVKEYLDNKIVKKGVSLLGQIQRI